MCGILGIVRRHEDDTVADDKAVRMMAALRHRGPDDSGMWSDGPVFLGHTRLSIIDLSEAGRQPFFSEDGAIIVVFNGEIYNHKVVRRDLERRGHQFVGASDGEVIAHLYEEQGISFVTSLRGMFAIALYDTRKRLLLLARDRCGIKPLYYSRGPGDFVFASEIKALLCCGDVPRKVDKQALHDYLSLGFIPEPATGYEHISSLLPGHILVACNGTVHLEKYWSYEPTGVRVSHGLVPDALETVLRSAVQGQFEADVPLGIMLSGGLDSSLVTMLAQSVAADRIPSFSVRFGDAEYDESSYASQISDIIGTDHHVLPVDTGAAELHDLTSILSHFDQPFGDSSAIPTSIIMREMRRHVKVVLTGDGGDEFFYGYPLFYFLTNVMRMHPYIDYLPSSVGGIAKMLVKEESTAYRYLARFSGYKGISADAIFADMRSYITETEKNTAYSSEGHAFFESPESSLRLFSPFARQLSENPKDAISRWLVRYSLPGDMLKKVDMMSMREGLEVRVPLLDESVVNLAESLPASLKHKGKRGKLPFRTILNTHLPASLVQRKKQGFAIPFDSYLDDGARHWLREQLTGKDSVASHLFKPQWLHELLAIFEQCGTLGTGNRSRYKTYQIVYILLSLELWLRKENTGLA